MADTKKFMKVEEKVQLEPGMEIEMKDLQFSSSDSQGNTFLLNCKLETRGEQNREGYEIKPGLWRVNPQEGIMRMDLPNEAYIMTRTATEITRHLDAFRNKVDVYRKYNLPPKRALLLSGDPGVGKSALIRHFLRQVAAQERTCVLYVDCTQQPYEALTQMFMEANPKDVDFILLVIEDVGGTELQERGNNVHGTLLNFLDGNRALFRIPTLIVATTNFLDLLGKVLKRPGRFDIIMEVEPPQFDEMCVLVEGVLGRSLSSAERDAFKSSGFTPAFCIEAIVRSEVMDWPIAESIEQLKKQRGLVTGEANERRMGFTDDDD